MFINTNHYQSQIDLKNHERNNNLLTYQPTSIMFQYNNSANSEQKQLKKTLYEKKYSPNIPKLLQIQFAQFLNNLLEYSSELTYFAINAFQTSSLRRVQISTLQRFTNFCVPRTCAFYYNLDAEFDNFVQKMRLLCGLAKRTFLDMRVARIHFSNGRMMSLPLTRRSIDIFKCNINRLRDLKQIHQDIGYDLLLPNDQLYLSLDLLVTDFELLNCELNNEVKFADVMILQTIIKDIFLQYRIALTWIYPAVKYAAYRPGEPNREQEIKKCDQIIDNQIPEYMKTSIQNTNNNYSLNNEKKKRKICSKKMSIITSTINDFNHYLSEKKLQNIGIINLKQYKTNKNFHTSSEINHIIKNMKENLSKK